jgi:hypothetical protein
MKIIVFTLVFLIALCFCYSPCIAQQHEDAKEPFRPHHIIGIVISHAQVFDGRDINGEKKVLSLPSWGLDYTFQFKPKWGIGLHTDIITETFEVEKHLESGGSGDIIERSYPIAPAVMVIYKPDHHWSFLLGAGAEFAKEENFFLNRAGVEYSVGFEKVWEVFGSLSYDFKWGGYDTWILGLGISKVLGRHKHSTASSND